MATYKINSSTTNSWLLANKLTQRPLKQSEQSKSVHKNQADRHKIFVTYSFHKPFLLVLRILLLFSYFLKSVII